MKFNFVFALLGFVLSFLTCTVLLFVYAYATTFYVSEKVVQSVNNFAVDSVSHFFIIFLVISVICAVFTVIYTFDDSTSNLWDRKFIKEFFFSKGFLMTCWISVLPFIYFIFILIGAIVKINIPYDFYWIDILATLMFIFYFIVGIPIFFIKFKKNRHAYGIDD